MGVLVLPRHMHRSAYMQLHAVALLGFCHHLSLSCTSSLLLCFGNAVSPSGSGSGQTMWLPTSCLQLLQRICAARPNHLLIAADFDELPDVAVPGQSAPLVASTVCPCTCSRSSKMQINTVCYCQIAYRLLNAVCHHRNQLTTHAVLVPVITEVA